MQELTCKEIVELVTDYIEGNLPAAERVRFEGHLADCTGCTNYLAQIRQTIQLTGKLREENLTTEQRTNLLNLFRDWKKADET